MSVLVVVEYVEGVVKKVIYFVIIFGWVVVECVGVELNIVVIGEGVDVIVVLFGGFGASVIYMVNDVFCVSYLLQLYLVVVVVVVEEIGVMWVVVVAMVMGADLFFCVVVRFGVGLVVNVIVLDGDSGDVKFVWFMYSGNIFLVVEVVIDVKVVIVFVVGWDVVVLIGGVSFVIVLVVGVVVVREVVGRVIVIEFEVFGGGD